MGMYINSATSGLLLTRSLYQASAVQTNIMKRLSSGIRINSASDDAAGLSLSQKLTSVINGNTVAKNNAQTGIAMLNTADGALSVMTNSLERIRNLAVQAANGVYSTSERQMLQNEVSQLSADIQQTYQSTKFSDKNVFGAQDSNTGTTSVAKISEAQATAAGYSENQIIRTAADFKTKITANLSGNFILVNDIDMAELGTQTTSIINGTFTGNLDGNGHSVNNLSISTAVATNETGLIKISTGNIKNISVNNANINMANGHIVGILVGNAAGGTISNCSVSGSVNALDATGGLAGRTSSVAVSNCSSNVSIVGMNQIGGLIGFAENSNTIKNSCSTGSIQGNISVGGLVGGLTEGTIMDSSSSANVAANSLVGGLAGSSNPGSFILRSSASGDVTGNGQRVGGFIGVNGSTIESCYATGNVKNTNAYTAGFVGGNNGGNINNSYSTGSVYGGWFTGGFIGINEGGGTVANSYTTSHVDADDKPSRAGFVFQGTDGASNFYKNNLTTTSDTAVNGNTSALPTESWNSSVWDTSGETPALKNVARASGTATRLLGLQIGDDSNSASQIDINTAFGLGDANFVVSGVNSAQNTINQVDQLMTFLNSMRSNVGASVNKLSSVITIQDNRINNLSSSKSTINDTDMAKESAQMIKTQIHSQAAISLMTQVKGLDANLLMQLIG